jgi:hypothetical protein
MLTGCGQPRTSALKGPAESGAVAGEYQPVGASCDEALFIQQGRQACFAAAGIGADRQ